MLWGHPGLASWWAGRRGQAVLCQPAFSGIPNRLGDIVKDGEHFFLPQSSLWGQPPPFQHMPSILV